MIRVNLLAGGPGAVQPRVWVPAEQRSSLIGLGMLLFTGLLVGGWWYYLDYQRTTADAGIVKADSRIQELKDAMKLLEAARSQKAELEERLALIDRLRAAKHAPVRMLHLFNATLPDGLWLLEIKQTATAVQIEGRAMSQTAISDFAKALQDSGFFKMPVEIVTTLMESVEETNVFRFVLKADPAAGNPTGTPSAPARAAARRAAGSLTMAKSFQELSSRTQLIIFGALCVTALAGAWQVSIGPSTAELETRRAKLAKLESEIVRVQAIADKLPALQREVRALTVALRETTAAIPEEKDPQDVLRSLHELASESSLDIASFKPSPIVAKAQYSEWPIQLGFEGGYHDLGRFFDRLAAMARLISVSDLNIKTKVKPNGRGTVVVSCLATTYVFRQEVDAPVKASGSRRPAMTCVKQHVKAPGVVPVLLLVVAMTMPVAAQIPVGSKVGEAPPSAGSYDSLGRRDPFVSLIAARRTTTPGAPRGGTGLASFYIADVIVTGIVRVGETRTATVRNADRQEYVAKVKDRLADGVVKSIDAVGVVFVEFADPGRGGQPREVRKLLHSVDEVKR